MTARPTLLFVHGAWHGAWCWDILRDVLHGRGWSTRALDLPTVHAADKQGLTLQDDADAVAAAVAEVEGEVVVVAHSYGGVPATQGATAANVAHLFYVAAFVLDVGESLLGAVGGVAPDWWVVDGPLVTAGTEEQPPASLFFGDVDEAVAAAATARLTSQSKQPFLDEVTVTAWSGKPSTYLVTEDDAIFPVPAQEALAARSGSTAPRLATSHSPFLSQPELVADLIEAAATP